jgi:hypothetical protein
VEYGLGLQATWGLREQRIKDGGIRAKAKGLTSDEW